MTLTTDEMPQCNTCCQDQVQTESKQQDIGELIAQLLLRQNKHIPGSLSCGAFEEPTKVRVAGPQGSKRKVAPDMRSMEKGEGAPPLAKAEASLEEAPPESSSIKASESLVEQNLSTVSRLSELESNTEEREGGILTWCVSAWDTQAAVSETRVAKAQAWETHALEAQVRGGPQPKPRATKEATVTISEETRYMSREESDVFLPRQLWSSKLKFILVMVSYLLMPIQLWRFVSQWLHKGGCSFLIMYTIMLFWIGIPLLFLEMAVGQRVQRASIDLWKTLGPWFGGLGYSTFLVYFITNTYTNLFNSWIFFYMSHIFYFTVPWQHCPFQRNSSSFDPECEQATSYTYFWYRQTLKASDRIEDGGPLAFNLGICLFLAWCLVCVFMMNGIKSFEKVLNVLVLLPYLIIFCFFFRTLPMEGTVYGLKHLLVLKVASIYDPIVWSQAGVQVMLDMGLGFGPIVYLSSYMPDFNNCLGDAFLMVLIKMLTLLFIMPVILSVLGFWATITTHRCCENRSVNKLVDLIIKGVLSQAAWPPQGIIHKPPVEYMDWISQLPSQLQADVVRFSPPCSILVQKEKFMEGPGLAYVAFSQVISLFPGSSFWAIIFFIALVIMGLATLTTLLESIVLPLQRNIPTFEKYPKLIPGTKAPTL
ncbi:orphan sodium- and chloride-dependent neurotransmitter transporter NTT5-like [Microtus ochrogaster]|uniref:Orphan sodium- and chloride-dependent neurotransmitter transporter NTT5-like n=1 Tax=Microtus ochrogaster TaxID=79684 RepID=A0ABM1USA9_MICOH|nr:orphan sodium- and chloride-dependent neurotransmitter transporter NTT5-like [Microtus ochrogaster]